jgi:hypothetical protein
LSYFDHRETRRPALRGAASISFRELVSGLDDVDAATARLLMRMQADLLFIEKRESLQFHAAKRL